MSENHKLEQWRAYRRESVSSEQGDLALVGLHVVNGPVRFEDIPGLWAPLDGSEHGLVLTASADEGITLNGETVDGAVVLEAEHTVVRFADNRTATATEQPGSPYLLAVWDVESDAMRRFEDISFFAYNEEWNIRGLYLPHEEGGHTAEFSHISDETGQIRSHLSPGDIAFEKDGETYRLTPFASGEALVVIFRDRTSGQSTYGLGRMVLVQLGGEDGKEAKLDFNKAFLPSCAFSPHFNCPMPPANNRLPFAVEAGEKEAVYTD
ncbi:DUF1684 domain-containing protein [Paenibacillus sp. NPDC058071]|uniref:DUF1684 domain-containing protein n=1 Tax=Paenibacillus sp. NPDC058071 TaxID=3346326 RepID=UPI0036DC8935